MTAAVGGASAGWRTRRITNDISAATAHSAPAA